MRSQSFQTNSQNPDYKKTHCFDRKNPFQFSIRQWYMYKNPQRGDSIITPIQKLLQIIILTSIQIQTVI